MGKVTADISMSLDGFITGPNPSIELGLGEGGERLHQWLYDLSSWREPHGLAGGKSNQDAQILDESFKATGAFVMGKRMFDMAVGPWGDNPPFHMPVFVLTHSALKPLVKEGGTTFTFVVDGVASAQRQARAAAGEKNVAIAGGANTIQQFINAGLLDEIQIHIVPVLLGRGIRLFDHIDGGPIEFYITRVVDSPGVTHLRFNAMKRG